MIYNSTKNLGCDIVNLRCVAGAYPLLCSERNSTPKGARTLIWTV